MSASRATVRPAKPSRSRAPAIVWRPTRPQVAAKREYPPPRTPAPSSVPIVRLRNRRRFIRPPSPCRIRSRAIIARRGKAGETNRAGSAVLLVALLGGHLLRHDQAALRLLAVRVEVEPAAGRLDRRVVADDVDVEDEAGVADRLEPVDVVLVVRHRRE